MKKPASNWTLLAKETLVPVCSPRFKEQLTEPVDVALLSRVPLIHVTVTADWAHWFRLSGHEVPPSLDDGLRVDTMQMAADAAIRGLGVALGRRPLVDDDIDSGRLIALFDRSLPSGNGYWLVTAQTDFRSPRSSCSSAGCSPSSAVTPSTKPARSPVRTVQGIGAGATRSKQRSPRA